MEYKINQFNLSDITFSELKELINCFEYSIPNQGINLGVFGPNIIHFNDSNGKKKKTEEDKKILSSAANLLLCDLTSSSPNNISVALSFSMSNTLTKICLKRLLKELNAVLISQTNNISFTSPKNIDKNLMNYSPISKKLSGNSSAKNNERNSVREICLFYDFLSFFIGIKDEFGDELSLADWALSVECRSWVRFVGSEVIGGSYEYLAQRVNSTSSPAKSTKNNINFFYMLLYNLPLEDVYSYLFCRQTADFFSFFTEEEKLSETKKRFLFMNQFSLLRNDFNFKAAVKNKEFDAGEESGIIYDEYIFYKKHWEKLEAIKEMFGIRENELREMIGNFMGIVLLSEFSGYLEAFPLKEKLFSEIIKANVKKMSQEEVCATIRKILISDSDFSYLQPSKIGKVKLTNILGKIAFCLGINEEKILYLMLTSNSSSSNLNIQNNIRQLIIHIYLSTLEKIKHFYLRYNQEKYGKETVENKSKETVKFYFFRSNLVHAITYEKYLLKNNTFINFKGDFIDNNSYIIRENVLECVYSNYGQEQKNFLYLNNTLSHINSSYPKIPENSSYLKKIYKESYNFDEIMEVYESQICGLLLFLPEYDRENHRRLKDNFVVLFKKHLEKRNKFEIIEAFNTESGKNEVYVKVKHTFGVFFYEMQSMLNNPDSLMLPQQKISLINSTQESNKTNYQIKSIASTNAEMNLLLTYENNIFISMLIELNKYNTLTLFDDMKINMIYFYYSNYFNYMLSLKNLRICFINSLNENKQNHTLINRIKGMKDEEFFAYFSKRTRLTYHDHQTDASGNFVMVKNKLSSSFMDDKNISLLLYKYNTNAFIMNLCDRVVESDFNYLTYTIKGVLAYVKLTKIYKEKRIISNVRNLLTDIIMDNYDIKIYNTNTLNNEHVHENIVSSNIDQLSELVFDFNKDSLSNLLPRLRSNLLSLKRIWKYYIKDIEYLQANISSFHNQDCTRLIIEQRLINVQILLFLFSKNYKFINSNKISKYGSVLYSEFTKTVAVEVLGLLKFFNGEFNGIFNESDLLGSKMEELRKNYENVSFELLINKRIELQQIINSKLKEKELKNIKKKQNSFKNRSKNLCTNESSKESDYEKYMKNPGKQFKITKEELNNGRADNFTRASRKPSERNINSINTINSLNTRNNSENKNNKSVENSCGLDGINKEKSKNLTEEIREILEKNKGKEDKSGRKRKENYSGCKANSGCNMDSIDKSDRQNIRSLDGFLDKSASKNRGKISSKNNSNSSSKGKAKNTRESNTGSRKKNSEKLNKSSEKKPKKTIGKASKSEGKRLTFSEKKNKNENFEEDFMSFKKQIFNGKSDKIDRVNPPKSTLKTLSTINNNDLYFSFISDNAQENALQTNSDVNPAANGPQLPPEDYATFPFELENRTNFIVKGGDENVRRKLQSEIEMTLKMKEDRERRKKMFQLHVPAIKELDMKLNRLQADVSSLNILDKYTEKLALLTIKTEDDNEEEFNEENVNSTAKNMSLNQDFYDEIEGKLRVAEEEINSL